MPRDQHIAGRHGARQTGFERPPAPRHRLLEVPDQRQPGEHRLHQQAVLPRPALTPFEGGGVARRRMEGRVAQEHQPFFARSNPPLQGGIRDLGRGTRPGDHPAPLIEPQTQCAPDHPAVIREACPADVLGTPAFAHGVNQLHSIGVDDAEHRRGRQEDFRPRVMGPEETQEPGALREPGKQRQRVACEAPLQRPVASTFEGMKQPQGDHFTGPEAGLGVFGDGAHLLVDLVEEGRDKIDGGHVLLRAW